MINKLDISKFSEETKCVTIGRFTKEMIDFICDKDEKFKNILNVDTDILFWSGRVKHTERHRKDFVSDNEFDTCLADIPQIIEKPDFVGIHPTDGSISFIKKYSKNVLVAIKISTDGKYVYRTMYPLRDSQLESYINSGRAWKYDINE